MIAKVVAIAGATGAIGTYIANALLDLHALEVRILARPSSIGSEKLENFKNRGAVLHPVSYDDENSLVNALKGTDVLISTVAINAVVPAQIPLIKAAKAAGVATFFPSEYGGPCENVDERVQMNRDKQKVLQAAKDAGLATTAIATGPWPEYAISPPLGFNFANNKVTIWGDPDAKCSFTQLPSIAQWVAHVLKNVPVDQLQNKIFNIQDDAVSRHDIIKLWEKKHQTKLEVEYQSTDELEQRINADPKDFLAGVILGWHSGQYELKPLHNNLYPEWKPKSIESLL